MSEFLPDDGTPSQQTGVTEFSPSSPATTQEDVALMQRVFQAAAANPLMIPSDLMAYIFDYIQTGRLQVPIGQVFGFQKFLSTQVATYPSDFLGGSESTTSTAYTDLATVGPTLTGLPAGKYVVFIRGVGDVDAAGHAGYMSISVNGSSPSDDDAIWVQTANFVTGTSFSLQTLSQASNQIVAKYRAASGTVFFQDRFMVALRYDNA